MSCRGKLGDTLCHIFNVDSNRLHGSSTTQTERDSFFMGIRLNKYIEMSTSMDIKYLHKENERNAEAILGMKSNFKAAFQCLVESDEEDGDKKPAAVDIGGDNGDGKAKAKAGGKKRKADTCL